MELRPGPGGRPLVGLRPLPQPGHLEGDLAELHDGLAVLLPEAIGLLEHGLVDQLDREGGLGRAGYLLGVRQDALHLVHRRLLEVLDEVQGRLDPRASDLEVGGGPAHPDVERVLGPLPELDARELVLPVPADDQGRVLVGHEALVRLGGLTVDRVEHLIGPVAVGDAVELVVGGEVEDPGAREPAQPVAVGLVLVDLHGREPVALHLGRLEGDVHLLVYDPAVEVGDVLGPARGLAGLVVEDLELLGERVLDQDARGDLEVRILPDDVLHGLGGVGPVGEPSAPEVDRDEGRAHRATQRSGLVHRPPEASLPPDLGEEVVGLEVALHRDLGGPGLGEEEAREPVDHRGAEPGRGRGALLRDPGSGLVRGLREPVGERDLVGDRLVGVRVRPVPPYGLVLVLQALREAVQALQPAKAGRLPEGGVVV